MSHSPKLLRISRPWFSLPRGTSRVFSRWCMHTWSTSKRIGQRRQLSTSECWLARFAVPKPDVSRADPLALLAVPKPDVSRADPRTCLRSGVLHTGIHVLSVRQSSTKLQPTRLRCSVHSWPRPNDPRFLCRYLEHLRKRAAGEIMTTAAWLRHFVTSHSRYGKDSVVTDEIAYDLVVACHEIGMVRWAFW